MDWFFKDIVKYSDVSTPLAREISLAEFDDAIRLHPNSVIAYINRGFAYYSKFENKLAIVDYNEAIRLDPNSTLAYTNRGLAHRGTDNDQALKDCIQAVNLEPDSAFAYLNRGRVYSTLSDYDRAIADYTQTIKLDPDYAIAYFHRGCVFNTQKRDHDRAIRDFTQAISLNQNNTRAFFNYDKAGVYFNRAFAYAYKDDLDNAVSDWEIYIKMVPNDSNTMSAMKYINRALTSQGKPAKYKV